MKLSKKQRGAFNEARAVAWLIGHGWEVFVQFGEGVVDLIGYDPKEARVVRVEVKSAQRHVTKPGDVRWYWRTRDDQMAHVDLLLVVTGDGVVFDATDLVSPVRDAELVAWGDERGVEYGVRLGMKDKREKQVRAKRQILDSDGNKVV